MFDWISRKAQAGGVALIVTSILRAVIPGIDELAPGWENAIAAIETLVQFAIVMVTMYWTRETAESKRAMKTG